MTSERWQQVNDLFQLAAERAPKERTTFLQTACQDDEGLRREVESLIACYERAENFIESPAFEVVPELLTDDRPGAIVGESIAHYRIESLIGVGGMGQVYLALDERLGRKVALKFLPERLTANNIQLSRFKSEARAASALNHPNILTVYEIGTEGNRHFIATEFIEGVTLRAALARGRMSVYDALEVAVQVASALAAAHETGVVHRDIKPENVMIRPDGYVKVLDFGLAKLRESRPNDSQTVVKTAEGMAVGSLGYMAPEQLAGSRDISAAADVYSTGVVLYEMVTGHRLDPARRKLPDVPPKLNAVITKALQQDPKDRFPSGVKMHDELRQISRVSAVAPSPKSMAPLGWMAAFVLIAVLVAGGWFAVRARRIKEAQAMIPRAEQLYAERKYPESYDAAMTAAAIIHNDDRVLDLITKVKQ